jgi:BirA family biotin operon repressor/biotin-[acetyl-CoA-carboxylase] ligase
MSTIKIIKVNATRSTNDKVKMLIKSKKIISGHIVSSKYQYGGRGQLSNRWYSSYGKNLLCSLYYIFPKITSNQAYSINYAVSLSVLKTVKKFISDQVFIKWPNDIMAGDKKISGILIENTLRSNKIYSTIIGTGININQIIFRNLPNATSIKQSSKKDISVDSVLNELIKNYKFYFSNINNLEELSKEYHENLYGLDGCTFLLNGETLKGKVVEVIENGQIKVKIDSKGISKYNSGDIKIII